MELGSPRGRRPFLASHTHPWPQAPRPKERDGDSAKLRYASRRLTLGTLAAAGGLGGKWGRRHGAQPRVAVSPEAGDSRGQDSPTTAPHRGRSRPRASPARLTITLPCILAVLIIAFSFISP